MKHYAKRNEFYIFFFFFFLIVSNFIFRSLDRRLSLRRSFHRVSFVSNNGRRYKERGCRLCSIPPLTGEDRGLWHGSLETRPYDISFARWVSRADRCSGRGTHKHVLCNAAGQATPRCVAATQMPKAGEKVWRNLLNNRFYPNRRPSSFPPIPWRGTPRPVLIFINATADVRNRFRGISDWRGLPPSFSSSSSSSSSSSIERCARFYTLRWVKFSRQVDIK